MLWKGIKFGMLLQLAIGPMCLMVFNAAATQGVLYGLCLMAAIAIVDALYIALSCAGAAAVISRPRVKTVVRWSGAAVLILFGFNMAAGGLGVSLMPQVALFPQSTGRSLFVQGLLLTASNPLSILFWGGVLSAQVIENGWNKGQLAFFAVGCVLSTVLFLTSVSVLASIFGHFLSGIAIRVLNVAVGVFLVFFGVWLPLKKPVHLTQE